MLFKCEQCVLSLGIFTAVQLWYYYLYCHRVFCVSRAEILAEYTKQGLRGWRDGADGWGTGSGGGGSGTQWAVTVRLYWLWRGRRRQQCTTRRPLCARLLSCAADGLLEADRRKPASARAWTTDCRPPSPANGFSRERKPRDSQGGGRWVIVIRGCCFKTPIVATPLARRQN